jgi:tRNA(ile)-lysidine synthetase
MLSLDSFNEEINKITRDFTQKKILLAVSGGADSMVMLDLFRKRSVEQSDFIISAAHINYKLRGKDSDLDQKIVEDYCEKYEIPLSVYSVSEKDNKPENGSIQLWARELRYHFFHQICEENSIDFIATAHHLNDQLETFFINLMRGSGLKGLSGIPANENQICVRFWLSQRKKSMILRRKIRCLSAKIFLTKKMIISETKSETSSFQN